MEDLITGEEATNMATMNDTFIANNLVQKVGVITLKSSLCVGVSADKLYMSADKLRYIIAGAAHKGLIDSYVVRYIRAINPMLLKDKASYDLTHILTEKLVCDWSFSPFVGASLERIKDLRDLGATISGDVHDNIAVTARAKGTTAEEAQAVVERAFASESIKRALEELSKTLNIVSAHQ